MLFPIAYDSDRIIVLYHTVSHDGSLVYLLTQAVTYLLYPVLGWLADVFFTRHKFALISFIVTIVGTLLTVISSVLFMYDEHKEIFSLAAIGVIICLAGIGLFESTSDNRGLLRPAQYLHPLVQLEL